MTKENIYCFYKADQLLSDEEIPNIIIEIVNNLPKFNCLKEAENFYEEQAIALEEALQKSLPQGVKDRLLIKLMKRKVSLYRGITN